MLGFFILSIMEIWKDIKGYEGYYQVSNLGRMKSLARRYETRPNIIASRKERILTKSISTGGYITTGLTLHGVTKQFTVHRLVYFSFTENYSKDESLVINHIDSNKENNHISNLELITNAENICHGELNNKNNSSNFIGVSWTSSRNKWEAYMSINKERKFLGYYDTESDARLARIEYQDKMNIKNKYSL